MWNGWERSSMYTGFRCGIREGKRAFERPTHKMEGNTETDLKYGMA
jgi:hypothetical protein